MELGRVQLVTRQQPVGEGRLQVTIGQGTGDLAQQGTEKSPSKEELLKETEAINKWLESRGTHLKFTLHEGLNEYYVQIINDETMEVIREIPSRKILDISAKLQEMIGLLIDERR